MSRLSVVEIDDYRKKESWDAVKDRSGSSLSQWGVDTLRSGLDGVLRCVVIEPDYVCKDHRDLFSAFYARKFRPNPDKCVRLHFFSQKDITEEDLVFDQARCSAAYMGFSVVRPVAQRCLGRTVLDPAMLSLDISHDVFCLRTGFHTHIAGQRYQVSGFPYMSQDTDFTVCAHSALWSIMRYLSERYHLYRETYPSDIVLFADSGAGRRAPYRGLDYADYSRILSQFGCYPLIMRTKDSPRAPTIDHGRLMELCSYVESGFPIIASYGGHAVAVVGHECDFDREHREYEPGFIDNCQFWSRLVVVDDNFFPFQLLGWAGDPRNYGSRYGSGKEYTIDSIWTAVCPLPEKAFLTADRARRIALTYVRKNLPALEAVRPGPWVTRLLLTPGHSFVRRKLQQVVTGASPDELTYSVKDLSFPHFIWLMEISPVDMYKRGECVAEVVLDATANELEDSLVYMRLGRTRFACGSEYTSGLAADHFAAYTHNLGEK